ncbi:hypothetical protein [Streptomyces sp. NPDC001165]|uniref:hypothetical protein n=1 Tax=Streptomyces sp. NPDC001165 TaxID=3364546 RepID=UPI003688663F
MAVITGILHAIDAIDAIRRDDGTIVPSRGAWAPQQHVDQARKDGTPITMKGLAAAAGIFTDFIYPHPTYATRWRLCLARAKVRGGSGDRQCPGRRCSLRHAGPTTEPGTG